MLGPRSGSEGRPSVWGRGNGNFGGRQRGRRMGPRRGQTSWRGSAYHGRNNPTVEQLRTAPVGELLRTITISQVQSSSQFDNVVPTIEDCEYVASYSWLNKKGPTILVPGTPPAWTPPNVIPKLKQDSGNYFRDPNAAHCPHFPVEPAVRAVFATRPEFEANKIDVVACGNTIGNLLRFAMSSERSFEFNTEVVGDTVFLVRIGNSPKELIPDVKGYGHTFPEACTSWDKGSQDSVSHQRVIKYKFGEINCLLRFESDGYLREKAALESIHPKAQTEFSPSKELEISSLLLKTKSTSISENISTKRNGLTVEHSGREIPQSAIFDLKTRSAHREIDMGEIWPRLWVSQIPNFIIAYHNSGEFSDIRRQDVLSEVKNWEMNNPQYLRKLYITLQQLISILKQAKDHKIGVRRIEGGPLEVRRLTKGSWSALPKDLKAKWTGLANTETGLGMPPSDPGKGTGDDSYEDEGDDEGEEEEDDYLNF